MILAHWKHGSAMTFQSRLRLHRRQHWNRAYSEIWASAHELIWFIVAAHTETSVTGLLQWATLWDTVDLLLDIGQTSGLLQSNCQLPACERVHAA
jgi:hypothetical protein